MSDSLDLIYKSLRVVPEFDGNPHVLTRFINLCDQIVIAHFDVTPGHDLQNLTLLNGILNKITGPAARLINSQGIADSWNGIRNALINNFADHRDETALYSDLSLQTQGSSTPQEFYERCQNLFSTIMTYISLHENIPTTIEAKRTLYQKLTLQSYLRGLKEPLGSRIRCMRPETMEKALEFVQEEINTLYLQQRNEGGSSKKDWQLNNCNHNLQTSHRQNHVFNSSRQFTNPLHIASTSRQPMFDTPRQFSGPTVPPPGWKPNFNHHHHHHQAPQYRMPTRTQQMFAAPPPNHHPNSNAFRMPHRPQPQPTYNYGNPRPMSGVSHFTSKPLPPSGHDWRKFGNPPPSNYFKTREVNMNELDCNYDTYYIHDGDQNAYDCCNDYCYDDYPYQDYYNPNELQPYYEPPTIEEIHRPSTPEDNQNFRTATKSDKPK